MKEKKKSPDKFKQAKITAFCLRTSDENGENLPVRINRKRKNSDENCEGGAPKKKLVSPLSADPDAISATPGISKRSRDEFENGKYFDDLFDDLENDLFLSPIKRESPKKTVLGRSSTWETNCLEGKSGIDFSSPKKCKVVNSFLNTKNAFEQILTVRDEKSRKEGVCKLREVWTSHAFATNDVVSIHATESEGNWVVDNKNGFVILYPDIAISSTVLVKSMFCMRQGVLSYFFKEAHSEANSRMLIGRLVHEFFQESLKKLPSSNEDFTEIVQTIMGSRDNFRDFLFSDLKVAEIQKEIEEFIPQIRNFLETYVNKESKPEGRNFNGTIEDILDIEELIQSPHLGFQGRIDVSVKVRSKNSESVAPLELKTGKATFSNEHRSQLILYVLLMKELGRKVDSGLLLYLREGAMEEIKPQRDEIRNLILLRNQFVAYVKSMKCQKLPEPIRRVKNCSKCGFLKICTAYLKAEEVDSHPLMSLEVPDVKPSHLDYFVNWSKMLWLESEEVPGEGEISELKLDRKSENSKDELTHFVRGEKSRKKTPRSGTFVHILDGGGSRVCAGQIIEATDFTVSVLTEKKLTDFSDTYKIAVKESRFLNFYLSNLGRLLEEEHENLRGIIADRKLPTFEKNLNRTDFREKCLDKLINLNRDQQKAVLKSLLCKDYLLIKGPPGTGKTETVVCLIRILLALGKSVLLAGHTHTSVDNVLLRLNDVEYLRLGHLKSIHEDVVKNSYSKLMENCLNVEDLGELFKRKLFASTCMGIDADFIRKNKVDVCIVDESSQVLQPEVLRPLFCCGKFILVGDDDQLPPIVRNPEAKKLGMDKSLFEWLMNEHAAVKLRLQYRMNSVINYLANAIAYDGTIECANEDVATATIKIAKPGIYVKSNEWIVDILSDDLERSVVFVDTSEYFKGKKEREGVQRCSELEANIIAKLVTSLIGFGARSEDVGIITPFWDQVVLLKKKMRKENLQGIELNTVDQYQGRDKDVIFFSCTKENESGREMSDMELLNDKRRLTVAVTRAKHKLVILGDRDTVVKYRPFEKLMDSLRDSQIFVLRDGHKSFFWKDCFD